MSQTKPDSVIAKESVGHRIKRARGYRGMSQVALAKAIQISKTALSNIETGTTEDPGTSVVRRIAYELEVNGNFLLGLSDRIEPEKDVKAAEAA